MSKSCKDCLHYQMCIYSDGNKRCPCFTDHSEWLHLPCNVGKKFFRTIPRINTIDECTVSSLTQKADETWKIRLTSSIFRTTFEITTNDIGKTVFFTREEAEKISKEKNNES